MSNWFQWDRHNAPETAPNPTARISNINLPSARQTQTSIRPGIDRLLFRGHRYRWQAPKLKKRPPRALFGFDFRGGLQRG